MNKSLQSVTLGMALSLAACGIPAEEPLPIGQSSQAVTPTRVGANYMFWQVKPGDCTSDPATDMSVSGTNLLQTYHLPGVSETARSQLAAMRANGLSSLRLMIWHANAEEDPRGRVNSTGGNLAPQYLSNWEKICTDIKNAGFSQFQIAFGPQIQNNPLDPRYNPATTFNDNWMFIYNVVGVAKNKYGPTVKVDLLNEGAPSAYATDQVQQHLTTYIENMWERYTAHFDASTATVSIADTCATKGTKTTCAGENWDPTRLENLYAIFQRKGKMPGWWQVHAYNNMADALKKSHDSLLQRGDSRPLVVGETFYDDALSASAIASFSGRTISDVLVWPMTRGSMCYAWNISPPYDDGAYGPSVTVYANSFENASDLSGWVKWHNCAAGSWNPDSNISRFYTANANPAPGGGAYDLRLETTSFTAGCQFGGAYALSPAVPATAGTTYRVNNMSRNHTRSGMVSLHFYNSAGSETASAYQPLSADAWHFNADTPLSATAPAGTTSLRVRYSLNEANAVVDMDVLRVTR